MKDELLIDSQWIDVVNPIPPENDYLLIGLLVISALLLIALAVQYSWRRRPKQILRRELKWLINDSGLRPKQRLRLLEQSICRYYNTAQLSLIPIASPAWQAYIKELQQTCYQRKPASNKKARELALKALLEIKELC